MGAVAAGEEFNADGGRRWRSTSQNWPGEWVGIDELGIDAKVRETRGEGIRTSRCRKFELSRAGVTWLLLLSSSFPLLPFFSSLFFRVISWPQRTLCCKSLLLRDPEQPSLVHIGQYSVLLPAVVWTSTVTTTVRPVRSKLCGVSIMISLAFGVHGTTERWRDKLTITDIYILFSSITYVRPYSRFLQIYSLAMLPTIFTVCFLSSQSKARSVYLHSFTYIYIYIYFSLNAQISFGNKFIISSFTN